MGGRMSEKLSVVEFRERYPEFGGRGDAEIEGALAEARALSDHTATLTSLCAAHLLALGPVDLGAQPDGGLGELASERVGPYQATYRTMTAGDREGGGREAFFATTAYGRRFLALEARTPQVRFASVMVR